jgi:hypothetical protein
MKLHGWATLLSRPRLVRLWWIATALVGLCGQRADATRGFSLDTPASALKALVSTCLNAELSVRASISETPSISADTLDVDIWYVADSIPLGIDDDDQHIELVTFLAPRSVLDVLTPRPFGELYPTSTRAGPFVAPEPTSPRLCERRCEIDR